MFELYSTPLSANGRKVMALARRLDLEPKIHPIDVYRGEGQRPDFLAIHPGGKIPVLVDEGFTLTESNAILQYISEAYGDFQLFSRDPKSRAEIASWMFWESAHWQPALTRVLAPLVGHALLPEQVPAPAAAPDWEAPELRPLLGRLEAHLEERPFLCGEVSIADFAVGGMTTYFRAAAFPFASHPQLAAWCDRLGAQRGWRETAVAPWIREPDPGLP